MRLTRHSGLCTVVHATHRLGHSLAHRELSGPRVRVVRVEQMAPRGVLTSDVHARRPLMHMDAAHHTLLIHDTTKVASHRQGIREHDVAPGHGVVLEQPAANPRAVSGVDDNGMVPILRQVVATVYHEHAARLGCASLLHPRGVEIVPGVQAALRRPEVPPNGGVASGLASLARVEVKAAHFLIHGEAVELVGQNKVIGFICC
mmetsp:Transcript_79877/g.185469  ORF Transcript_79877/g.185469 Transcript_79877/m.185469 type:complete len:203 (+) Transcript_79877:475-1083(+)